MMQLFTFYCFYWLFSEIMLVITVGYLDGSGWFVKPSNVHEVPNSFAAIFIGSIPFLRECAILYFLGFYTAFLYKKK